MAATAAILNERWHWSSEGTFLHSPPISHKKIEPVDRCVCQKIDGNQIQDGCCGGHLEWVAALIIDRNLPPVTPNYPQTNWTSRPRRSSDNLLFSFFLSDYSGYPELWILRYPAHRYSAVSSPGFEPTTLWLRVRRPSHSATTIHDGRAFQLV
jgi:hypothetical protein